jgi:hypothetical protein
MQVTKNDDPVSGDDRSESLRSETNDSLANTPNKNDDSLSDRSALNNTRRIKSQNSRTKKRLCDPAVNYAKALEKIYPVMDKIDYDKHIVCNGNDCSNYNVTYGEINYDGIEKLYKSIMSMFFDEYVFIDIGSGNGKVALYLASKQQIIKSIGIELVKERYDYSLSLFNKLNRRSFLQFTQKIQLHNNDMFNVDFSSVSNIRNRPNLKSIVWISNLCFGEECSKQLFGKLSKELPEDSIVCFSKLYESMVSKPFKDGNVQSHTKLIDTDFIYLDTINIPMSWNVDHMVHIFIKACISDEEDDDDEDSEEEDEDDEDDEDDDDQEDGEDDNQDTNDT